MKREHVLIIRFSALGDVAMAVPVVWSLASQYPKVRFTVLSRPFARPLFEHMPDNVSFMEADVKQEYHGVKGLNRLYRRLTAKRFTAVADLHNVLRSEYLRMRFNLGRFRVEHINKHRHGKRRLVSNRFRRMKQLSTSIDNYCEVFQKLGYPVDLRFRSIFPPEGGDLGTLPEAFRQKEGEWIGVAPFAAHPGKTYPPELTEQVIALLTERHRGCRIFLFGGGKAEMDAFAQWEQRFPQCVNASGQLGGLADELVLMSHLDAMLTMDSSNMHLASLTATPVVSIWGATHPYAGFMGYGQPSDHVLQADLSCRPCSIFGNKPCRRGDYACLHAISPAAVADKLEQVINNASHSTH